MYRFCSQLEAEERQKANDVHPLEATPETASLPPSRRIIDPARAVKKYVRSGSLNLHRNFQPRSIIQLKGTCQYLFQEIWWPLNEFEMKTSDLSVRYTFVMDRIQSVRQEIISESISARYPAEFVAILKSIIRFYVHSMIVMGAMHDNSDVANLGAKTCNSFDLHLHENALSSCLATAIQSCQDIVNVSGQEDSAKFQVECTCYSLLLSLGKLLREAVWPPYTSTGLSSSEITGSPEVKMRNLKILKSVLNSAQQSAVAATISSQHSGQLASLKMPADRTTEHQPCFPSHTATSPCASLMVITATAKKCLRCVHTLNPAGVLNAFTDIVSHCVSAGDSHAHASFLCTIGLLCHMLPEVRFWRLLLADVSANKDEFVDLSAISRRLRTFTDEDTIDLRKLIGIPTLTPPSPSPSLAQLVISHETGISDKATTNNSDSTGSKVILKASKAESCTTTGTHDTTTNAVNTSKNTQNAKQLSGHENENGSLHAMRAMLLGRDIVAALIQPYGNGNSNGDSHGNGVDAQVTYDERVSHLKKSIEGMTFESDGEWDGDGDDNCLITGRSANDEVINSGPNDLPSVKCDPLPSNTPQRIFTSLDISNILRTASAIDWFVL